MGIINIHYFKEERIVAIEAYVYFNGNCREAVEYYADVFGTEKPVIMTYGDVPDEDHFQLPEESKNLVMHTNLTLKGSRIMFSDVPPGMPPVGGNNISLSYLTDDTDEITRIFNRMKEEGTVNMELQESFWTKLFGSVTDKYGIEWMFSYEDERV